MAHQCVKYRLTAEGTVPDFLYLGDDGVGGVYVVSDSIQPAPRDMIMVGITNDNASGDFEAFSDKSELQAYLTVVGANWTEPDVSNVGDLNATIPFDAKKATDYVWGRLEALNSK